MSSRCSFDYGAMIGVLDAQRTERGMGWGQVADELYEQSEDLNTQLADHRICPGALVRNVVRRGPPMSCQYAITILRWIARPPEEFLVGSIVDVGDGRLPSAGPQHRLRFDLPKLYSALDHDRVRHGLTWVALAAELSCTPSRLTNLRHATQADLELVLRITQRLGQPAANYVHATDW